MESDSWSDCFPASKRNQPAVQTHLHLSFEEMDGEDYSRGEFSCPFCSEYFDIVQLLSTGEGMAAIPIIKHCVQQQPDFIVLMTTTTTSAFNVIKDRLPNGVIYQFAPLDTPAAVDAFLGYWNPNAIFLLESELWPNLILSASKKGIALALLNARMSAKSYKLWSGSVASPLISFMLSKFSLIAPLSTREAVHFQLLGASPFSIHFAGDLKYAAGDIDVPKKESKNIEDLQLQIANRPFWMAASIHRGEEEVMIWIHKELKKMYPHLLTIIVPRHPQDGKQIARVLQMEGMNVVFRSQSEKFFPSTNFYVVDTLGELRSFYRLTPIAVIGGSFLPGLAGHNISEAAASGCAILTGPHVGHFSQMVQDMQQSRPLSVQQVSGKLELLEALKELLSDAEALEARRTAAKEAFLALSVVKKFGYQYLRILLIAIQIRLIGVSWAKARTRVLT